MYWPLGVASTFSVPEHGEEDETGDATPINQHASLISLSRTSSGNLLATLTVEELHIWQTQPMAVLAAVRRSASSLQSYGKNVKVVLHASDNQKIEAIVYTDHDYLIVYSITSNTQQVDGRYKFDTSRQSISHRRRSFAVGEPERILPYSIKHRRMIKVDSGLSCTATIDDQLLIATEHPPAIQCIHWQEPTKNSHTELIAKMSWIKEKSPVVQMVFDKPTSLFAWITRDGKAYAVRRPPAQQHQTELKKGQKLWKGWLFHDKPEDKAICGCINARFSLIAVACESGAIDVYVAKDYSGNIPFSHRILPPREEYRPDSRVTQLAYSPDGYALFVGTTSGWYLWSVYGHLLASSFIFNISTSNPGESNGSSTSGGYVDGVLDCCWAATGLHLLALAQGSPLLYSLPFARSVVTSCYNPDTIAQPVLQTEDGLLMYRGSHQRPLDIINPDSRSYGRLSMPAEYVADYSPIRLVSVSADIRYLAIAGKVGFAHLSTSSGRWRVLESLDTFDPSILPEDIPHIPHVRGGLCWYNNILLVGGDFGESHEVSSLAIWANCEVRLYHRNATSMALTSWLHRESFNSSILLMSLIGDSLLVYCQDNILYHFVIVQATETGHFNQTPPRLVQFGQINFKGIIHSPARVRAISWILPDEHTKSGDPSEDAAVATIVFLLDGKLVILTPSTRTETPTTDLKYDMRVLSDRIEHFQLLSGSSNEQPMTTLNGSIWAWDGKQFKVWISSKSKPLDDHPILIELDFYPLTILPQHGIISGLMSLKQRQKTPPFTLFKTKTSNQLFIHRILDRLLENNDLEQAIDFATVFSHLDFFTHILELLLHDTLEIEADNAPPEEDARLPRIIKLLEVFPRDMLDVVVGCTRKTEVRLWRYLFQYAGRPKDLFEQCMELGMLKSAGGYLLVLHTLEHLRDSSQDTVRLLTKAIDAGDWDLCKELARFLTSFDNTGSTLRKALVHAGLPSDRSTNLGNASRRTSGFMLEKETVHEVENT